MALFSLHRSKILQEFRAAAAQVDPILHTLYMRLHSIRETLDDLTHDYCLNLPLCEHLSLADGAIAHYIRSADFLDNPARKQAMNERQLAFSYRELIRSLFELHPPVLELSRPVVEVSVMKQGAWETLQFKLTLVLMELERILDHPEFMEHAMAIEEFVLPEKR